MDEATRELLDRPIAAILAETTRLELHLMWELDRVTYMEISLATVDLRRCQTPPHMEFGLHIRFHEWTNPWTFSEFGEAFRLAVAAHPEWGIVEAYLASREPHTGEGFFRCFGRTTAISLGEELDYWGSVIEQAHTEARERLLALKRPEAVVALFRFPEAVRAACGQYLPYFTQFLEDLGVQATAELREDPGGTLFTVVPKDKTIGLDNIREALAAYLAVPTAVDLERQANNAGLAAQQLLANVHHLRGQLALAQATIEAKDVTIEALRVLTEHSRDRIAPRSASEGNIETVPSSGTVNRSGFSGDSVT